MSRRGLLICGILVIAVMACDRRAAPRISPHQRAGGAVPLGYQAREGKVLFEYYCATCHGIQGEGDGFNSFNLDPKPRNLADPELQRKRSDDDLIAVIRTGGGAVGLSTGMPPWGRTLSERKIRNIVDYLRTLHPAPSGS